MNRSPFDSLRSLRVTGLLFAFSLLSACGPANLGGPCNTTCDCKLTTAPVKCPGEWICNAQSTCEYTCKNPCETGGVYTCSASDDCNGSICSSRLGCR
jgi:hypothetical protein